MACDAARCRRRYGFEGSLIDRAWTRSWDNMMVGVFLVETVIIGMNYGTNDEPGYDFMVCCCAAAAMTSLLCAR